jgi:hypothetical protein
VSNFAAWPTRCLSDSLLEALAQVPDIRKRRGRPYALVLMVAVACVRMSSGHRGEDGNDDEVHELVVDRLPGEPAAVVQRPEECGDNSAEVG